MRTSLDHQHRAHEDRLARPPQRNQRLVVECWVTAFGLTKTVTRDLRATDSKYNAAAPAGAVRVETLTAGSIGKGRTAPPDPSCSTAAHPSSCRSEWATGARRRCGSSTPHCAEGGRRSRPRAPARATIAAIGRTV